MSTIFIINTKKKEEIGLLNVNVMVLSIPLNSGQRSVILCIVYLLFINLCVIKSYQKYYLYNYIKCEMINNYNYISNKVKT